MNKVIAFACLLGSSITTLQAGDPFKPIGSTPPNKAFESHQTLFEPTFSGDDYLINILPDLDIALKYHDDFYLLNSNATMESVVSHTYTPGLAAQISYGGFIGDAFVKADLMRTGRTADNFNGAEVKLNGFYTIDSDRQLFTFYRYTRSSDDRFSTNKLNLAVPGVRPAGLFTDPNERVRIDKHTVDLKYVQKNDRLIWEIGTFNDFYRFAAKTNFGDSLAGDANRSDNALFLKASYDTVNYNPLITRVLPYVKYQIDRRGYHHRINSQGNKRSSTGHDTAIGFTIFGPTSLGSGFFDLGVGYNSRQYSHVGFVPHVGTSRFFALAAFDINERININAFFDKFILDPAPGFSTFTPMVNGFIATPLSAGFQFALDNTRTVNKEKTFILKGQYTLTRFENKFAYNPLNAVLTPSLYKKFRNQDIELGLIYAHDYFRAEASFLRTITDNPLFPRKSNHSFLFKAKIYL